MNALRTNVLVVFSILLLVLCIGIAFAASNPTAPSTLTPGVSSTFDATNYAAQQTDALAGNITGLTLTAISQTRAWQGYLGNVTGTITLDDASNYTFYNWTAAEPRGYIYASLVSAGVVSWADVVCFSHAGNGSAFDSYYSIGSDDYDNVSNTYDETLADITVAQTVYIGSNTFTTCPATAIYQSDAAQNDNFVNYLMWDSTGGNDAWVFGTIIESKEVGSSADKACYNGQNCDFQILVAENGHGNNTAVTPYYFWVDLSG